MKRFLSFFFVLALFFSLFCSAHADNRNLTVYVASGSEGAYRYHARSSCAGLKNSVVAQLTLAEAAAKGFTSCQRCHPPEPDFPVEVTPRPSPSRSASTSGGSGDSGVWTQTFTASPVIPDGQAYTFSSGVSRASRSSPTAPPSPTPAQESKSTVLLGYLLISALIVFAMFCWALAEPMPNPKSREEQPAKPLPPPPLPPPAPAAFPSPDISVPFFVGEDGLPRCKDGDEKWGTGYTFYMTPKGRCFHTRNCEIGLQYDFHPINAYTAKTGYRYYNGVRQPYCPCSICKPVLPDLAWYEDLLRLHLWATGRRLDISSQDSPR